MRYVLAISLALAIIAMTLVWVIPALTAMIGFWATLSLNMPDFTRFGAGQKQQVWGQVLGLPTTMTVFAAMGVMITSASAVIYGQAFWDPVHLVAKFTNVWIVAIAMFTVVVATWLRLTGVTGAACSVWRSLPGGETTVTQSGTSCQKTSLERLSVKSSGNARP